MSRVAFTLIELLIVVFIIGIVSFLVIKLPSFSNPKLKITDLREILHPNKSFYLFSNGNNILIGSDKNKTFKTLNITISAPIVYIYSNKRFIKKFFKRFDGKNVVFKYSEKRGIGKSFILVCDEGVYLFKPLWIKKVKNFEEAKREYLLSDYLKDIY